MALGKQAVLEALGRVRSPGGKPLSDAVEWVAVLDDVASVKLHLPGEDDRVALAALTDEAGRAVRARAREAGQPLSSLRIEFVDAGGHVLFASGGGAPAGSPEAEGHRRQGIPREPKPAQAPPPTPAPSPTAARPASPQAGAGSLPGITHAIAVGAGKGGVGKSTVAVNLAVGLARKGHAVGLLDGDIYGPSLPTMLGLDAMEQNVIEGRLQPFYVHGVKAVSIGKLVDAEKPLIWRGPMAHGAFSQLVNKTDWGELDYLIIDLPPGTGDVPLTLAQSVRLTGSVVVCTPQKVAQDDAVRAARMFQQLNVDVLGVVENMSFFIGDDGKEYDIFGRGGAEAMAQRLNLPYLGGIPINTALRRNGDQGDPSANFDPATAGGETLPRHLTALVEQFESQVALASLRQGRTRPTLSIS